MLSLISTKQSIRIILRNRRYTGGTCNCMYLVRDVYRRRIVITWNLSTKRFNWVANNPNSSIRPSNREKLECLQQNLLLRCHYEKYRFKRFSSNVYSANYLGVSVFRIPMPFTTQFVHFGNALVVVWCLLFGTKTRSNSCFNRLTFATSSHYADALWQTVLNP